MADEAEDNLPPEGEGAGELESQNQEAPAGAADEGEGEQSPPQGSEVEELAREMGWAPKDQWRGDANAWKDAKSFLKTTVEINRTLSKDVRGLKDQVERIGRTSAKIAERAIADDRDRLLNQLADATANNDPEGAYQASLALNRMDAPAPGSANDPLGEFRERNEWFDTDPEARALCVAIGDMHKGKEPAEVMRLAEAAVRKRFPEHFDAAPQPRQQQRAPAVNSPGSRTARPAPKERGVSDLPPEARKAGEDFVRRGRIGNLADYARIYFEENA